MTSRHIRRLPVVEADTAFGSGKLMLAQLLQVDPGDVPITAHNGIVTLACMLGSAEKHDLIRVAGRLAWTLMAWKTW